MDTAGPLIVTDHAAEREACRRFRAGLYGCLTRRADASFELADTLVAGEAVATAPPPHLSLEPAFRRGWGSTYGALRRGRINEAAVRDLLAAWRPAGWPAVFTVDASSWARCDAECSPERGYYHHPSRHSNGWAQLRLARGLVADCRLPWEPPRDPGRLTPTRVRRGFRRLVQILGTPASPPKPTKAGPGRPRGSLRGPAPRYPAIKKAA